VGWIRLNAGDASTVVASAVVQSLRRAKGNSTLGQHALEALRGCGTLPALTALLAEIADRAAPAVLIFDDCERVSDPAVLEILDYLLQNVPPNLQIATGSRCAIPLQIGDLLARANLRWVTTAELRFDLAETLHLLVHASSASDGPWRDCKRASCSLRILFELEAQHSSPSSA